MQHDKILFNNKMNYKILKETWIETKFKQKHETDSILICVNIYTEKYSKKQIDSINKYCLFDKITIIYNCSTDYNEKILEEYNSDKIKIIINPERIDKKRHTGLISKGIISNLLHQKSNEYSQILLLSERTIFDSKLSNDICNKLPNSMKHLNFKYNHLTNKYNNCMNKSDKRWFWNKIFDNSDKYVASLHEGLVIDGKNFNKIINYLNSINLSLIYESDWCIEEYIFTQICYILKCKINSLLKATNKFTDNSSIHPTMNHYKCFVKIIDV